MLSGTLQMVSGIFTGAMLSLVFAGIVVTVGIYVSLRGLAAWAGLVAT